MCIFYLRTQSCGCQLWLVSQECLKVHQLNRPCTYAPCDEAKVSKTSCSCGCTTDEREEEDYASKEPCGFCLENEIETKFANGDHMNAKEDHGFKERWKNYMLGQLHAWLRWRRRLDEHVTKVNEEREIQWSERVRETMLGFCSGDDKSLDSSNGDQASSVD
jgi:hypothetical protein